MKKIHLIGICGSGMGSLAGLCKEAGFEVRGSDTSCYPPMSDQLAALKIPVAIGFHPKNLDWKPDVVVIGNVCSKDNVEVQKILELGLSYFSLPQALQEFFLKNKKALVVAGTHGKTTTSTLLAWVLTSAGFDPGFLIGGVGLNLGKSYRLGKGDFFVVEGDEYDTAFFDKGPKFAHYKPAGAILTSIEWDHVDIYPTFEKMLGAFKKFLATLAPTTPLLAWADVTLPLPPPTRGGGGISFPPPSMGLSAGLLEEGGGGEGGGSLFRYGLTQGDYTADAIVYSPEGLSFTLCAGNEKIPITSTLFGNANIENILAVCGLCHKFGLSWEQICKGVQTFKGVKKRQEVKGVVKEVTVIDDFAHHPTAVSRTIEGLKKRYMGQRLIVVFEPRSNTSRRKSHYNEYLKAFKGADRVLLAPLYHPEKIPPEERLDTLKLADDLMRRGIDAYAIDNDDALLEYIVRAIGPKEVVVFFSNGDFGNMHQKLLEKLERRKIFPDKKQVRSIKVQK